MTQPSAILREKHDGRMGVGTGDQTDTRANLRLWLRLLSCTMVVEKRIKSRLRENFETTLPRFDVLAALDRHPEGMTLGALSSSLLVSNGNVTALVQTLLKDGHATLTPSPHDRRASIVAPTPAGSAAFATLAAAHHDWIDAWLGGLSATERDQLFGLLGTLKGSIARTETI